MSDKRNLNAFRPITGRADLSHLPEHIRQAVSKPVPVREREFHLRVTTYTKRPVTSPAARMHVLLDVDEDTKVETVMMRMLDYTGKDVIALAQISKENLPVLLAQLLDIHQSSGGSLNEVLEILQGSKNTP